jgi:hypothetical protein
MLGVRMGWDHLPPLGHKCCISRVGWHGRACRASLMRGELCQIQKAWDMLSVARWPVWLDACWLGLPRLVGSYDMLWWYVSYVYIYMIWYVILIEHMTDVFDAYNIWLIWHMRFCNKCLTPRTSNSQWNSWVYRHRLSSNKNTFFCLDAGNGLVWRNLSFQKRLGWFIENWIQKKDFALLKIVPPFFEMETTSKNHDFVAGVQKLGTPPFTATADFTFCGFGKEFTRSVPSGYVNSWLLKMTHWNSGFTHW